MDTAEDLVKSILEQLRVIASTETIIGDPFQAGDTSIIPVSRVSMGIGVGGGGQPQLGEGSAGGGGVKVEPIAFLVVKDQGVSLLNIGRGKGIDAIYEKVPELVDKIVEGISERLRKKKEAQDHTPDTQAGPDVPPSENETV
ncbi:MAG: GerW family sporulation protein [Nitrospiria bacterium]